MPPTPFEHGLALAWSDGALSRDGAIMLEVLQKQLGLSDAERAEQEQNWLSDISKNERRSFGDGDKVLRQWLEGLDDRKNLSKYAQSMGKAALEVGLSKTAWKEAYKFADGLGIGDELANGVWLEKEAESIDSWPAALDPLALILGLVFAIPNKSLKPSFELSEGAPFAIIDNPDAKPTPLSWMPGLVPIKHDNCAWGWGEGSMPSNPAPEGDLVYCDSILLSWIKRLIAMRINRQEPVLVGLQENQKVLPSSAKITSEGNKITLSMIVDLGEGKLVQPWASVTIDGDVEPIPAPEGLGENWTGIHNAITAILTNALDNLPRQLLLASGIDSNYRSIRLENGWLTHQIV